MSAEARLKDLGLTLPQVPTPVCAEKLDSNILVVQPTDHGMRHDTADLLDWARNGCIHVQ